MHNHSHSHKYNYLDQRQLKIKIILLGLLCLVVFVGAYYGLKKLEFGPKEEISSGDVDNYEEDNEILIRYDGKWYKQNPNLTTTLVIGVDKEKFTEDSKQSDFLLLLAVDEKNKSYRALQINRDTMVDVNQLDFMDNVYDTKNQQIALAYAHGNNERVNCKNTIDAVENLLYGINIDHYISVSMDAVPIVNDGVGGVPVYVEDDFSGIDPVLKKGETITLLGKHALTFVRSRKGLEDPTNLARMERQRAYLNSLREQFDKQDDDTILDLVLRISNYFISDCTPAQLSELINLVSEADDADVETIDGDVVLGVEYAEFHVDEESLTKKVMDMFFVEDEEK